MASNASSTYGDSINLAFPAAVALEPVVSSARSRLTRRSAASSDRSSVTSSTNSQHVVNPTKGQTFLVIICVTVITAISTLLAGVVTVTTPTFAREIGLAQNLLFWPASIFSLTCGCTLLVSGALADVVGSSNMYLIGSALQSAFTLACGLSTSGTQLILFRGLAGIATSLCLPSAVSIITNTFEPGKRRNIAFSAMGGGQPIGFAIGLTIGGVFADTIGWRWAFHLAAIINTGILVLAIWGLPNTRAGEPPITWSRMGRDIDWVGAIIATSSISALCYVLAMLTGSSNDIKQPLNIALLSLGILLIPAFGLWEGRQESLGRPAVIPNSLWRNRIFVAICLNVFITWGTFNATETMLTFVFQDVQHYSALKTSIYFLPAPFFGAASNVVMGLISHKVNADRPVLIGNTLSALSPLIMAFIDPKAPYWSYTFPAICLNAIGADVLFTVSNLVITSVFPERTQALAGGVFNTVAQVGKTVGLATSALLASSRTASSEYENKSSPQALLDGYKAAFWYCFALCATTILLNFWGLRKIGKVGAKRD